MFREHFDALSSRTPMAQTWQIALVWESVPGSQVGGLLKVGFTGGIVQDPLLPKIEFLTHFDSVKG